MAAMFADFQSFSTVPWSSDAWNSIASGFASSSAAVFKILAGIASDPEALCVMSPSSNLWTPCVLTVILAMVGWVLSTRSGMELVSSLVKTKTNCHMNWPVFLDLWQMQMCQAECCKIRYSSHLQI